jgi:Uri superfamily endonuclease
VKEWELMKAKQDQIKREIRRKREKEKWKLDFKFQNKSSFSIWIFNQTNTWKIPQEAQIEKKSK